jgi:hypothetical protein
MSDSSPTFLTIPELAAKYAVEGRNCKRCFKEQILKWRRKGWLMEASDWHFVPPSRKRPGRFCRAYCEHTVITLILDSESEFCADLRINHIETMRKVVPRLRTQTTR